MTTLKIISAKNKGLNGKLITFNESTGIAKMGRTEYSIECSNHQPNINKGDYSVQSYKLEDLKTIVLHKLNSKSSNTGIIIREYEIL